MQWSDSQEDAGAKFDDVSSDSVGGGQGDRPRHLTTAPTLSRVIVFKSALADSSDEENVENEVYSSEDEENDSAADRSSIRSVSNDFISIPD